jgi:hypothetical protein
MNGICVAVWSVFGLHSTNAKSLDETTGRPRVRGEITLSRLRNHSVEVHPSASRHENCGYFVSSRYSRRMPADDRPRSPSAYCPVRTCRAAPRMCQAISWQLLVTDATQSIRQNTRGRFSRPLCQPPRCILALSVAEELSPVPNDISAQPISVSFLNRIGGLNSHPTTLCSAFVTNVSRVRRNAPSKQL